jgi:hypothetical protein
MRFFLSFLICIFFLAACKQDISTDQSSPYFYHKTLFTEKDHTGDSSPHTFSVVKNPLSENPKYFGYAGEQQWGNVDLWMSDDLTNWTPWPENPIIDGCPDTRTPLQKIRFPKRKPEKYQFRWPTVVTHRDTFWMVHSMNYRQGPYLILRYSTDGILFQYAGMITEPFSLEYGFGTTNPFIMKDKISEEYVLFYQYEDHQTEEIRIRKASHPGDFKRAEPVILMQTDHISFFAKAPGAFLDEKTGIYWLLTEGHKSNWNTYAYYAEDDTGPYQPAGAILTDNSACPFPYVENDTLNLFICYRCGGDTLKAGKTWQINLVRYDMDTWRNYFLF